jgi:hypothetical protein
LIGEPQICEWCVGSYEQLLRIAPDVVQLKPSNAFDDKALPRPCISGEIGRSLISVAIQSDSEPSSGSLTVSLRAYANQYERLKIFTRPWAYLLQQAFELVLLHILYQHMFVVDVLYDEIMIVLGIDLDQNGFDRRVAFNQNACAVSKSTLTIWIRSMTNLLQRAAYCTSEIYRS